MRKLYRCKLYENYVAVVRSECSLGKLKQKSLVFFLTFLVHRRHRNSFQANVSLYFDASGHSTTNSALNYTLI